MNPAQVSPPPYAKTGSNASPPSNALLTSAALNTYSPSLPSPSAASSLDGSIIYTPPYTPTGSLLHGLADDDDHVPASSAKTYFDSISVCSLHPGFPALHSICVTSRTEPQDLPYPEPSQDFLLKGLTRQDWQAFVNCLLPDHLTGVENDVADRKLEAELTGERMHRLTSHPPTSRQDDCSKSVLSQVDTQLNPLCKSLSLHSIGHLGTPEATVNLWNEKFFLPRGIQILLAHSEDPTNEETSFIPGGTIPYNRDLVDHHDCGNRGRSHSHGRPGRERGRSSSASSSSSSASSRSSDSDVSLPSLPDYEDLKDQQLPVTKQSLIKCLNHPQEPITREDVCSMKQEIQAAKMGSDRGIDQDRDIQSLREEVKRLMKELKSRKKAQRMARKQKRKERRAVRREQRKERRAAKKEQRKERRSARREGRKARKEERNGHGKEEDVYPSIGSQ